VKQERAKGRGERESAREGEGEGEGKGEIGENECNYSRISKKTQN